MKYILISKLIDDMILLLSHRDINVQSGALNAIKHLTEILEVLNGKNI